MQPIPASVLALLFGSRINRFEMGIAFEATDPSGEQIMAESEPVSRSHKEKVKELEGWDLSPFTYMKLEESARGFFSSRLSRRLIIALTVELAA
jgi:hypothetical protein